MFNLEDVVVVLFKVRLKCFIFENFVYEKWFNFCMCWYVYLEVFKSFGQECLLVFCQWIYIIIMFLVFREDSGSVFIEGFGQSIFMLFKWKLVVIMCIMQFMKKWCYDGQVGFGDMDGFQVDIEEDEEDDIDCMIIDVLDVGSDVLEVFIFVFIFCK